MDQEKSTKISNEDYMTDEEEITAVHYRLQVETLSVFSSVLVLCCSHFNRKSPVQNMKVARSLGGLKSNLLDEAFLRCGKHLVAISLQSSPGIPGRGHSRIDTGPGTPPYWACSFVEF